MEPYQVDYVIYHGNCSDGFGSAVCAYKYFNEEITGGQNIKQPILLSC